MGPRPPIGQPLAAVMQARAPVQAQAQQPLVPHAMARARAWGAMADRGGSGTGSGIRAAQPTVGWAMAWAKGTMAGAMARAEGAMAGATVRSLPRDLARAEQALAGTVARGGVAEWTMAEWDLPLCRDPHDSTPQLLRWSSPLAVQRAFHFRHRGARAMPRRAGPRRGARELGVQTSTGMCSVETGLRMAIPRTHARV